MAAPRERARRGDVWWVDFGDPIGHEQGYRRPAVVVSHDRLNASRAGVVFVTPLTTANRSLPTHVEVTPSASNGLSQTSYAKTEDTKSVSMLRLERRLGEASPARCGRSPAT